jgi:dihydroorotase (multifunctional complex type)
MNSSVRADEHVDADEGFILPGVVDSHVHFRDPGNTEAEDFETGTRAAAAGGVTTVIDMPNTDPWVTSRGVFQDKKAHLENRSHVDFGLYGAIAEPDVSQVKGLAEAGASSLEAFTAGASEEHLLYDDFKILRSLETIRKSEQLIGFYSENHSIWRAMSNQLRNSIGPYGKVMGQAKPPFSEESMVARILALNENPKARVILRQISVYCAIDIATFFRRRGQPIRIEVCTHHLVLTQKDADRLRGFGKISPPLRAPDQVRDLWSAISNGSVDMISSDHSPHTSSQKSTDNIIDCPPGFPGVQTSLSLMLNEVAKGKLSLPRLSQLMSTNPAKVFGLYPEKGALIKGSRADITIVDLKRSLKITGAKLHHKCGWTPYENMTVKGKVTHTILGGNIISIDAEIVSPPRGKFIKPTQSRAKKSWKS